MQGFFISIIMFFLASYFITETWTWGYQNQYTNWRNYIPHRDLILTEEELARHDGSDPNLPIYIAINGEVFDVTAGKMYYGKDGGYKFFSGKDAARAYITGCFETHLTHDLRGLSSKQIKELDNWADFYRNHHTYYKVGRVIHPPIDPKIPIPEPCK
jgi:predicted heme/steroid binding protein